MDKSTMGDRLRRLRGYTKLSARALDQLAGVARGTTAMLESRTRSTGSARTVRKYTLALGCSVDWLLMGVGKPPSPDQVSTAVELAKSKAA